eukprot:517539_1
MDSDTDSEDELARSRICLINNFINKYDINSIILSDIDSYFVKNPWNLIYKIQNIYQIDIDIIGQRGIWPNNCNLLSYLNIDNTAICIGFMYFKINNKTRKLFNQLTYNLNVSNKSFFSDQEAINCYVYKRSNILNKNVIKIFKDSKQTLVNNITFIQNYWNLVHKSYVSKQYELQNNNGNLFNIFLLPSFIAVRYHCNNISFYYS